MHSPFYCHSKKTVTGFTLVELLVATAIALSLMLFAATVFSIFGQSVNESQDILRLHDQMRSAAWSLRQDLSGVTCTVTPWQRPEADAGNFELIEGPANDFTSLNGTDTLVSDIDDVLMFTTQRLSGNFVGEVNTTPMESSAAEVAWFCLEGTDSIDGQPLYNLHRRRFLVRSYLGTTTSLTSGHDQLSGTIPAVYQTQEVSLRNNGGGTLLPNGLSDLTKRENRFFHRNIAPSFPFAVTHADIQTNRSDSSLLSGEDIILNNVIAFDVRVFDLEQSPPAYIDLGGSPDFPTSTLSSAPAKPSSSSPDWSNPTYCTWSQHYESNGIDEDNNAVVDQGTNGQDDNGNNIPDDSNELETQPPYNIPLGGIEIRIRCIEPKSKQIRQITVRHSFPS